jgi:hypothetical protein
MYNVPLCHYALFYISKLSSFSFIHRITCDRCLLFLLDGQRMSYHVKMYRAANHDKKSRDFCVSACVTESWLGCE